MHDLRKKALLESGKTMSRKARSRPESKTHSPMTSPPSSRTNSRPGSRYASEDEGYSESEFEDSMTASTNSGSDDALDAEMRSSWPDRLHSRVSELEDRKRTSVQDREGTLTAYLHLVRHHFADSQIDGSLRDIFAALAKSIHGGGSAHERSLALKSLAVTLLTCQSTTALDAVFSTLKSACRDAEEEPVKADAIYAMTTAVLFGGGDDQAAEDFLEFLVEIVESDGRLVDAEDSTLVVIAAMQAWGFVATFVDDLSDHSETAMEAFVEQLDSSDSEVQVCAGSNIAFLFEVARKQHQDLEEAGETGETLNLPYDAKQLAHRMNALTRGSKSMSKKDRRSVRSGLTSVITSLELGRGPGYSTAGWGEGGSMADGHRSIPGVAFGYREKIGFDGGFMEIDTWSLMARWNTLKVLLRGGFMTHFIDNPTVTDLFSEGQVISNTTHKKGSKKH